MEENMGEKPLHIAMFPWFAMSHITSFLHLSNKLAQRGHKISFMLPSKTELKFESLNLHPNLITFIPITVPQVDGLPPGAETTYDVPSSLYSLLMTAMDLTEPVIAAHLHHLKPHFVFFDFAHWMPLLARKLIIKSVHYFTANSACFAYFLLNNERRRQHDTSFAAPAVMRPSPKFPPSPSLKLHAHEVRSLISSARIQDGGGGIILRDRLLVGYHNCDAIMFKACTEMEGPYIEYVEKFGKPVILAGPVLPVLPKVAVLQEGIAKILNDVETESLVYCALGSECVLNKHQFQELVLGLELTGLPFLAALKPPTGAETIESALPEGFEDRVRGRGFVYGGWVQQQLILNHPSVGCFVTHCGAASLFEGMVISKCQLVLLPSNVDQFINARLMGGNLKVGVEVKKGEEDGLFTRDDVCKAIKAVMDPDSEVRNVVKTNLTKWREILLTDGFEDSYFDGVGQKLHALFGN